MIRASSILFWSGLAIVASLAFYRTTDRVQSLGQQLYDLNASIEAEQKSIHVLKAEWVYLANPARVETEAKKHLALRPTAPQQVARMSDLAEIFPTRGEAMSSVAVNATPIATVKTSLAAPAIHTAAQAPAHLSAHGKAKPIMAVASVDTGHINDHMIMQHATPAPASPDAIGSLINKLDEQ